MFKVSAILIFNSQILYMPFANIKEIDCLKSVDLMGLAGKVKSGSVCYLSDIF
jgi:hypothetical protein